MNLGSFIRWTLVLSLVIWAEPPASQAAPPHGFTRLDAPRQYPRHRRFDLRHTRFDVKVDVAKGTVAGTSSLTVRPLGQPLRWIDVDAVDMQIISVKDDTGASLRFEYNGRVLSARLAGAAPVGKDLSVHIRYTASPKQGLHFVAESKQPRRRLEAWTQGETENTRHWLPSYDYPDDTATSEGLVTVKDPLRVLSNGRLVGEPKPVGGGWTRYHWKQDKAHVTYLIMLAISSWRVKEKSWRGKPISFWFQPEDAERVDRTFMPTFDMLDFFTKRIGVDYPWSKYAQVVVRDYMWGGMENTSATVLTVDTLHDARAEPDYSSQNLVAHELAHQWFGDMVTCRGWAHIWLNEGFATYFAALYREHKQGWDDFIGRMFSGRGWLRREMSRYQRPIVTHAFDRPFDMFDAHSYTKGAWVLHALRGLINDDTLYFKAISTYLQRFAHKVAETSEFRRVMERVTGRDLGRFFRQWLHQAGLPEVTVTYAYDVRARLLTMSLSQTHAAGTWIPAAFELPLDVVVRDKAGKSMMTTRVMLRQRTRELAFALPRRPSFVEVDPRGWTPGRVSVKWPKPDAFAALDMGSTVVVRKRAARNLGQHAGDRIVAQRLLARGQKEGWFVAQEVARSLGKNNTKEALEGLLMLAKTHSASDVRAQAAEQLAGGYETDRRVRDLLEHLIAKDISYKVVAAAARGLGQVAGASAVGRLEALAAKVRSPWEVVGSAALSGIARGASKRAYEAAKRFTSKRWPQRLRGAALAALGQIAARNKDFKQGASRLLRLASVDRRDRVRRGVVSGLEALGGRQSRELLDAMARRESVPRVRRMAEQASKRLATANKDSAKSLSDSVGAAKRKNRELERRLRRLEERMRADTAPEHPPK